MARRPFLTLLLLLAALPALAAPSLRDRLEPSLLSAVRTEMRRLRAAAQPSERSGEYLDLRCVLHAHSALSHDSRGTEAQILAAAKAARVRAVFMTEHPTAERKWASEGLRGEKDGVLFIPGAELSDGLLIWRGEKAEWTPDMKAGDVLEKLNRGDGVGFIAHPEQRKDEKDWELPPFAGMEIYNSHADAADNDYESLLTSLRGQSPARLLSFLNTLKKYPRESYAAIFDEQTATLQRWDALNVRALEGKRRVVGIAGNDAHQNVGLSIESGDEGLIVKDALGRVVSNLAARDLPLLFLGRLVPGATVLSHTFDPYEVSFGYVSTHLLAEEASEKALFDALLRGRAYVAFDWLGDPSGFRYFAAAGKKEIPMGGDVRVKDRPVLTVRPNAPCQIRLLRNGQEVQRVDGPELTFEAREPGVYRAEAWVALGESPRPWVYTNPIYVK